MSLDRLCAALAEPDRLRVFAAVVLGATALDAVADRTGLPAKSVATAVRRLADAGLVTATATGLVAEVGVFKEAVIERAPRPEPPRSLDPDAERDAVLRAYIKDGRIVQIPATRGKRRVVLEYLATVFEPGVRYPEPVVNATLRAWHDDHAALRRYLVDEGLMSRAEGLYWRCGGPT